MSEGESGRDDARGKPVEQIKVTDRRHFTSTGERRSEVVPETEEAPRVSRNEVGPEKSEAERGSGFERRSSNEPEGVDFAMLVNAMAQPALLFLGEIPHPATHKATVDLEQAKLQIDMLEVLAVKCRGNLTPQEEKLLDRWLYELRMLYVSRSSGIA